jgi:hypothetical protein
MIKKISILAVIAFCIFSFGMKTNAQINAINITFYVQTTGTAGPFTMRVAIEDYLNNVYNVTQLPGTYNANTTYNLPTPWLFPSIPLPPQPPIFTSYCRVIMSAYYSGTTKFGESDWTYPDVYGYIYPNLITITF